MSSKKNLSIETLRGIAILLVMIGHVIGSVPDGRMKTYLRYFTFIERGNIRWFIYVHFTALSTWLWLFPIFYSCS